LRSRELRKNGRKVLLQGQPFQVFAILLREAGKVVMREELRQAVWPGDTFVDFDHGLNTAVTKIRTALGDSTDSPRFVETLPRLGYRFIASVDKPVSLATAPPAEKSHFERHRPKVKSLLAFAALAVLISGIAIWRFTRNHAGTSLPVEIVPLLGLPGLEIDSSFSPDGNQVAFVIHNSENSGIYTTVVGGEKSMRVTTHPGDRAPRWSPDGRQLAFLRYSEQGVAIYTVPVLGGTEHRLYSSPAGIKSRTMD
jgi:DNA-binding winged helix-turn-helix (wHTH) protein